MKTLDIISEQCPMTFVKTKIALSEMKRGEILEVLLREGEPLKNVPRAVEGDGAKVLSVEKFEDAGNGVYKVVIEK